MSVCVRRVVSGVGIGKDLGALSAIGAGVGSQPPLAGRHEEGLESTQALKVDLNV